MAVVLATKTSQTTGGDVTFAQWSAIATPTTDTYEAIEDPARADRSVQVFGAVGAAGFNGCTVTIQGSNDGTNWATLTDPQGVAITFTASGFKQITEVSRFIRPSTSGATTGSTPGVLITLAMRRN